MSNENKYQPSWVVMLIGTLVMSVCVNFVQNTYASNNDEIKSMARKEWVIEYVSSNIKPLVVEVQSVKENVIRIDNRTEKMYEVVLKISEKGN